MLEKHDTMENRRFSCFDLFVTFISLLTLLVDIGTDVVVISQFFMRGSSTWGSLMLVFTAVPLLVMNVFSLKWHATDGALTRSTILLHLLLLAPIHRYVKVLWLGYKSCVAGQTHLTEEVLREQNDVTILRLLETFLEAAPQLVIQLYVMLLQPYHVQWFQGLSAACSLLSLAWALTAYSDTLRLTYQTTYRRRLLSLTLHCCWRLFMASARVTALVLFASVFHAWLFLFAGVHWCLMTAWIWHQGADFGRSKAEQVLFRIVSGFIYIFVFLNVHDGPTRFRVAVYYSLAAVENAVLFAVWCKYSLSSSGLVTVAATVIATGFTLGLLCMVIYYRWFHPSSDINLFSVTPTVATSSPHGNLQQSPQGKEHGVRNSSLHSPSPGKGSGSNPDISSSTHQHTPGKRPEEGGNLTLSFLLDSATKGELQWPSGMSASGSDSECSSVLSEGDRRSFSLSRSPSQSPLSATLASDQGYNSSLSQRQGSSLSQEQSPPSASNQTSIWCTPSSSSSSWSGHRSLRQDRSASRQTEGGRRRGEGEEHSKSSRCACDCCKEKGQASAQASRCCREGLSSCNSVWSVGAGVGGERPCSYCACSPNPPCRQSCMSAGVPQCSTTHPLPGSPPSLDCADFSSSSSSTTLSPFNVQQLWRESLRRVISSTVRDLFPAPESSLCNDLSRSDRSEERSSSKQRRDEDRSLEGKGQSSEPSSEKTRCGIAAPLAQPESSDISGRSTPNDKERPLAFPYPASSAVPQSTLSDLVVTSTPLPPSSGDHPHDLPAGQSPNPSDTSCWLQQLKLDPAPPVHAKGCQAMEEALVHLMLGQLQSRRVDPGLCRSAQGSPLRTCCMTHSPPRLGRNVDLFDPQTWRRGADCPGTCPPLHHSSSRNEAVFGDSFSDSDSASSCEEYHHHHNHTVPQVKAQREGLYRYFIDAESDVCVSGWTTPCRSYQDLPQGSPGRQCVWSTTPSNSCSPRSYLSGPNPDQLRTDPGPRRKTSAAATKSNKYSRRSVTWEDQCENPRITAYKTSNNLNRLNGKDVKDCSVKSPRTPLKALQNSPHFSPSLSATQRSVTSRTPPKGSRPRSQNPCRDGTPPERREASGKGWPDGSVVHARPHHQHRYRQAAGRKADRRSASRSSPPHPLVFFSSSSSSMPQSPPGLEMII